MHELLGNAPIAVRATLENRTCHYFCSKEHKYYTKQNKGTQNKGSLGFRFVAKLTFANVRGNILVLGYYIV